MMRFCIDFYDCSADLSALVDNLINGAGGIVKRFLYIFIRRDFFTVQRTESFNDRHRKCILVWNDGRSAAAAGISSTSGNVFLCFIFLPFIKSLVPCITN